MDVNEQMANYNKLNMVSQHQSDLIKQLQQRESERRNAGDPLDGVSAQFAAE